MEPIESKRITKNLLFIKDNITQLEKIMDKLIEDDCLGMDERADILSAKRTDKQCHKLLDILLKRGGNSYSSFIEALEVSGNHHVATRIQHKDFQKDDTSFLHVKEDTFTVNGKIEFEEAEVIQLYEEKEMYLERVKELEVSCTLLQNENYLKEHKIDKLNQDVWLLKQNAQQKYDEIDNVDETCVEHLRKLDEVEAQCKTLEEENAHLQIVQRSLQETISDKEVTMKNLNQEREFYKKQMNILQADLRQLQNDNAEKDAKIQTLNEQIRQLKIDLQNTRQAMDKMATDSRVAMEQLKTDHSNRFNQLDNKLDCVLKMLKTSKMVDGNVLKSADVNKNTRKQSIGSHKTENRPCTNASRNKPGINRNQKI
ncbi:uncharacterized protein MCAP_0864-like [Mytilus edulis]|uniref:uncharacterized protein MCAP_0864-like n=1 Tax=Mytilus edulis TaxID=6550 RepID=UPI0039EFC4E7